MENQVGDKSAEQQATQPTNPANAAETAKEQKPFKPIGKILDGDVTFVTNFEGTPQQRFEFLSKVMGAGAKSLTDSLQDAIDVRTWYAHRVELENKQTGEMNEVIRIAIVNDGGEAYTAVSDGLVNSLDMLRQVFGEGPYNGEVVVKVQQVKTSNGFKTYNLVAAK